MTRDSAAPANVELPWPLPKRLAKAKACEVGVDRMSPPERLALDLERAIEEVASIHTDLRLVEIGAVTLEQGAEHMRARCARINDLLSRIHTASCRKLFGSDIGG